MESNCKIIADLMPLCAEGLASEDSTRLVETHIAQCEKCTAEYAEMRRSADKTESSENTGACPASAAPIRRVKMEIRKRRVCTAALCALAVFTVMVGVFSFLMTRRYIPYSSDAVSVERDGDAFVVSVVGATGCDTTMYWATDEPVSDTPDSAYIEMWNTRWDELWSRDNVCSARVEDVKSVYYCDCANGGELILLSGEKGEGSSVVLERLVLTYYFLLAFIGALFFGLLWLIFRKKCAGKVMRCIFFLCSSYLLGTLVVMGPDMMTYAANEKFIFILLASGSIFAITQIVGKMNRPE